MRGSLGHCREQTRTNQGRLDLRRTRRGIMVVARCHGRAITVGWYCCCHWGHRCDDRGRSLCGHPGRNTKRWLGNRGLPGPLGAALQCHCGPCSLCSLLSSPNVPNVPSQRTNPSPLSLAQGALLDAMHLMQCILRRIDSATIKKHSMTFTILSSFHVASSSSSFTID
jgi:hypothetical protein